MYISVLLTSLSALFIIHFFFFQGKPAERIGALIRKRWPGKFAAFFVQKGAGGVLFLVFPAAVVAGFGHEDLFGWFIPGTGIESVLWLVCLPLVTAVLLSFRKSADIERYPEIGVGLWNWKTAAVDAALWLVYLTGYEFMFRGALFFPLMNEFGLLPAIGVNIAVYSISHIPKGKSEAIGAFFYSPILCLSAYYTGSIIPALLSHLILALSNDLAAARKHPGISFFPGGAK